VVLGAAFLSGGELNGRVPDAAAEEVKAESARELTQAEIEARLADPQGPLSAFVKCIEHSILSGRTDAAEKLVDRDGILARATRTVSFKGDKAVRELFCDSTKRAWEERGLTRDYAGTRFMYLRPRTLGGRAGLLFRSSSQKGAVNYVLFNVTEPKPGDFRVSDMFVVGINEYLSDTLGRTWVNVAAGLLGNDALSIKGVNPEYVACINAVAEMSRQLQNGDAEAVLEGARLLPESVQKARTVLLMRIEAGERISLKERDAAYAAWLEVYPNEMELPLKFVHFYRDHRRWDDAERVLRGLMEKLGEDSMLKMELGTVLFRKEAERKLAVKAGLSIR
jgi:hypothetical protein